MPHCYPKSNDSKSIYKKRNLRKIQIRKSFLFVEFYFLNESYLLISEHKY